MPVSDGSITDFTGILAGRSRWRRSTRRSGPRPPAGPLAKVLVYTEDPIVSSDIVGSPASCTFDSS